MDSVQGRLDWIGDDLSENTAQERKPSYYTRRCTSPTRVTHGCGCKVEDEDVKLGKAKQDKSGATLEAAKTTVAMHRLLWSHCVVPKYQSQVDTRCFDAAIQHVAIARGSYLVLVLLVHDSLDGQPVGRGCCL